MDQLFPYQSAKGLPDHIRQSEVHPLHSLKDPKAFRKIYDKLYLPVYHFARTFVDAGDAEDITADSFLKLWRSNLDYTVLPKVKTWLNVCTRNACLDFIKDKKRETITHQNAALLTGLKDEGNYDTDIRGELLERINSEIEKLPPQCKKVFKMVYLEGLKSKEIAAVLHISENTVSNHRAKGIKLLKIALKTYPYLQLGAVFILTFFYLKHG